MTEANIFLTDSAKAEDKGQRLDKFLSAQFQDISRSQIQRLIEQGNVSIDDDTVFDNSYKVKTDDIFQLIVPPAIEAEPAAENIALEIIFEDADIIVVNKPAGMTVHPAPGSWSGTLVNALLYHCNDLSGIGGVKRPGIVHRIDKETSGLLVVAKNDQAHQSLSAQFFEHSIERTYFAIVHGVPTPISGKIDKNVGRSKFDRQKMATLETGGKKAITHYKTIKTNSSLASLIQCNLETGRTHQIRVHMSSIGNPLIGDPLYGKSIKQKGLSEDEVKAIKEFSRQALHATTLGFIHPKTKEKVSFKSSFPADFEALGSTLKLLP